ncbi:phasin [Bradyrhizobium sp. SRL28]|uniref:phasin n=1 Tax=Bradyrhizobium sp. SRL28 TaxID=2836178 RepID=UPI001BDEF4D2|nr:phasin [Bradyrhizobium sp. SRL28]MBT1516549.1 phasin [Bradyrhizobium sp. SRL28]
MMETKIEVPAPVRELVAIGINNAESALALFFDAVSKLGAPTSAQPLALLERIVTVRMDYARKVAGAKDLSEATALQFAFCRSQIDITTDLIRVVSGSAD